MPRNACAECRSRKIKCTYHATGAACERCTAKQIRCSNAVSIPAPIRVHSMRAPVSIFEQPSSNPSEHSPSLASDAASVLSPGRGVDADRGYDIGSGTPWEILREAELTEALVSLYFDNFSDIHFMFERDATTRDIRLGGVPKMILYAMMALGIRYSSSPVFESTRPAHRGEALFQEARKLLKDEFDLPSLMVIQMYILLGTYHLTFGAARRSWIYLGYACSLARGLKLIDISMTTDVLRAEMVKRLVCTITLMDRMLSPSLGFPPCFTTDKIPDPYSDDQLQRMKRGLEVGEPDNGNITAELMQLSRRFQAICTSHRMATNNGEWAALKTEHEDWNATLHDSLAWSILNSKLHASHNNLRQYLYLHLLNHHVSQLIYFRHLRTRNSAENTEVAQCHHHATMVTNVVEFAWTTASMDLHNVTVGQALTVATAVHVHAGLTATTPEDLTRSRACIATVRSTFSRVRKTCRIFDRISAQLETFLQMTSQNSSLRLFERNENLIGHMLHYGSGYERGQNRTTQIETLGATQLEDHDAVPAKQGGEMHATTGILDTDQSFTDYAAIFLDESLDGLFSIPFMDAILPIRDDQCHQP